MPWPSTDNCLYLGLAYSGSGSAPFAINYEIRLSGLGILTITGSSVMAINTW